MRYRLGRAVGVTALAVSLFSVAPPAHAATASGSMAGGLGSASCGLNVTCSSFTLVDKCAQVPSANDADGSVRSIATLAGRTNVAFRWSATSAEVPPVKNAAYASFYTGTCRLLDMQLVTTSSGTVSIPAGTKWVVVYLTRPHAQGTWSIG